MNFPDSVSNTSTRNSYDDYRRGIQSASSIPIMLSLGLPPSTPHQYPTADSTIFSHSSPSSSDAGSPTASPPKSTLSEVTEDELYEPERAGAIRGADFEASSGYDNTASDTATPNWETPIFPAPESGTRPRGAAYGPGNSYDPVLSELTSTPWSSSAADDNAAGDDADTESFVQPNRRFSSFETAKELEGQLEVPDLPEISAGYADIYHGIWTTVEGRRVEVAVKEFRTLIPRTRQTDPEALRKRTDTRIRREVFVWSQTQHRNLHPLLGYLSQPQPRLISPWCQHGNLMDYIRERPSLSRSKKLRLMHQTACGLAYLHSRTPPICHADIKPENILVNDRHEAALSDFGLSRVLEGLGVPSGLTTTERVKGTLNYMASELFEGGKANLRTDVYAFGGLILTVMSGKPPFTGLREPIVMRRIVQNELPRPEDHPIPVTRPPIIQIRAELSEDPSHRTFDTWQSSNSQLVVATAPREDAYSESVPDVELQQMVMPLVEKPLPKMPGQPTMSIDDKAKVKTPEAQPAISEVRAQLSKDPSQEEFVLVPSSSSQTSGSVADFELQQKVMQHIGGKLLPKMSSRRQWDLPAEEPAKVKAATPRISSIISIEDKAKIKSAIPEGSGKILHATLVRIYYAHPDPNRWTYIGQEGAMTLVADRIKGGFWFRMIDLKGTRGVTWEHELYDDFTYYQDRPFFHSFPGDSCLIAFIFADERDANAFFKKFNGRAKYASETFRSKDKNVPAKTVKKKSGKPGKIDKSMISAPTDFKHVAHMGWSEDTGFRSVGVDESWNTLVGGLERFGITEKQLKGNEEFIQQFIEKAKAEGLDAANQAYGVPGPGEGISKPHTPAPALPPPL